MAKKNVRYGENWVKILQLLKQIEVDWRYRRLIRDLYVNQKTLVRVNEEFAEPEMIERGARQRRLMSAITVLALSRRYYQGSYRKFR